MSDILATALAISAICETLDGVKLTVYEAHLRNRKCDDPGCPRCNPPEHLEPPAARAMADAIDRYMEQHGRAPPPSWKPGK